MGTTLQTDNKSCAAYSPPQGQPHGGLQQAHEACARLYRSTMCARRDERDQRLTVKTDMAEMVMVKMVLMVTLMEMVLAQVGDSMLML